MGTKSAQLLVETAQKLDQALWLLAELTWRHNNHTHVYGHTHNGPLATHPPERY